MIPFLFVARTEPVRTPKFSSDNASDKRQFCRTHARVVASCAFTPVEFPFFDFCFQSIWKPTFQSFLSSHDTEKEL